MRVTIYTDGSCFGNPGPGKYAAILLSEDGDELHRVSGFVAKTTNNRMEMMGAIAGLEWLKEPCRVTVYSDSMLLVNCASRKWRCRKNLDLWRRLFSVARSHEVRWKWVRGHDGDRWNEAAHKMCQRSKR